MEVPLPYAGYPTKRHAENELVVRAKLPQDSGGFLPLAELLRKIRDEDTAWFTDAYQAADIKRRRAFALAKVDEVFGQGVVPAERLAKIGWSKLAQIASHVSSDKKNLTSLLIDAERLTARELEISLASGEEITGSRTLTFTLSADDYAFVEQALILCKAKQSGRGLNGKEQALVRLAKAYIAANPQATA